MCKQTYKSTDFLVLLWTNWTRFRGWWDSDTNIFKNSTYLDLVALVAKTPPANGGDIRDVGSTLGRKYPLEEVMGTHSSILAWEPLWTEEAGGLQSMGSQSQTWVKLLSTQAYLDDIVQIEEPLEGSSLPPSYRHLIYSEKIKCRLRLTVLISISLFLTVWRQLLWPTFTFSFWRDIGSYYSIRKESKLLALITYIYCSQKCHHFDFY